MAYRDNNQIIVIHHTDIDEVDKKLLEKQLMDCDSRFLYGLADNPHEEHKGEFVSAIYAIHFEIPFLKSNDGTFKKGNVGRLAFPDLCVKNLSDMLCDLLDSKKSRNDCLQLIFDNRKFMDEGQRIYKEEKNAPVTEAQVTDLLKKLRA